MGTYGTFLFLGLGNGAVYAALAVALVVTYRSSGVLNFATGAQSLYAAYTYTLLRQGQLLQPIPGVRATVSVGGPMGFVPALLITLAIQALLGAIIYLLIFRPLRNHRAVAKAVASLGLASLLTALVNYQVGTQQLLAGPIYPQTRYTVGGVTIPMDRVWFTVTIIAVALALTGIFRETALEVHKAKYEGKVAVDEIIVDACSMKLVLNPWQFDVLLTTNMFGDILSDLIAGLVGGLGMAPGANIGDGYGVFEATHGTAPKYADKDVINPGSVMLSGAMMFEFMGWKEVAALIESGIAKTIQQKKVTYDLERMMEDAKKLKTSEFAAAIIENM